MPDIIVKQQPATSLTIQSNSTQLIIRQAASNNITVATTGNSYVLPAATASTLGGVKIGSNLTIDGTGLLSANIPPGGVESFNGRAGNVTLTANDVTAVANGIYQANGSYLNDVQTNVNTTFGLDALTGMRKSTGIGANFVAGKLTLGTSGAVGVFSSSEASAIEFRLGQTFATMRIRQYAHTLIIQNSGFEVESGTANWTWSDNSVLTQGRGDARYQNAANNTYANLTGKPTFATVATSGSYTDLANTPNLSLYYLANNPSGYITAACLTYGNITGTPNLSLYLTTANAATTYLPSANFTYANIGGTIPTATNTTLGAIKVGSGLAIANGVLSSTTVNIDGGSASSTGSGSYDGGSATTN